MFAYSRSCQINVKHIVIASAWCVLFYLAVVNASEEVFVTIALSVWSPALVALLESEGGRANMSQCLASVLHRSPVDIDVHDLCNLFKFLDDGSGEVSIDDFIVGLQRTRGLSKGIDTIRVLKIVDEIGAKIDSFLDSSKPGELLTSASRGVVVHHEPRPRPGPGNQ